MAFGSPRWIAQLALAALLASAIPSAAAEAPRPVRPIRVEGNQFVDTTGRPVVFRGVALSDPDKLQKDGQWTRRIFDEVKAWGANIVRLPVHPLAWRARGEERYLALLDEGVRWAREAGLYVLLDWHVIGNLGTELMQDRMYDTTRKETLQFWRAASSHYRDDPTVVLYELFNEPTDYNGRLGRITWAQWKPMLEEMIGVIRANDPSSLVVVAGLDWAYELRQVTASPIDAPAVAYASHPYPQKRPEPWEPKWEADWGHVAAKYPVFVTEFGFSRDGSEPFVGTPRYGRAILDYMAKRNISWAAWCFDTSWVPTLIRDWQYTPTEQGALFKAALQGRPLPPED
jgi:aryl-phospho-beta-D-glucosidase BglC (GH1 family)